MKHLKAKLMAAVAMLLVATVMLTSASFAWFTISTNPEIASLDTEVVTNENLEIALVKTVATGKTYADVLPAAAASGDSYAAANKDGAYTWGNIIDLTSEVKDDTAADAYSKLDRTIRPITLSTESGKEGFQYPKYGEDGRVKELTAATVDTMAAGFGNIKDTTTTGAGSEIYGYYVDFWLRSNVGGKVKLVDVVDRAQGDTDNGFDGGGSSFKVKDDTTTNKVDASAKKAIAENMRVAFQVMYNEGTTTKVATYPTVADATYTTDATSISFVSKATGGYEVINLDANKAAVVRMFVYLEGEDVTNAAASIDGAVIYGDLNVQFGIDGVDKAMHETADATYQTSDAFHS